jgi:hypothetical protein
MNEFTLKSYVQLLELASARYNFQPISRIPQGKGNILWRHDIDFSPKQAFTLAEIEAEVGVKATYYVQISSLFYSVFDTKISKIIRSILDFGHEIGLHFDPSVYMNGNDLKRLNMERVLLSDLMGCKINSFSLHNPTTYDASNFSNLSIEGMTNASSPLLRENFFYCSDSNGLWKYQSLGDVLHDHSIENLYVLTHPVWWTEKTAAPRSKIINTIQHRSIDLENYYDKLLEEHRRPNIRS